METNSFSRLVPLDDSDLKRFDRLVTEGYRFGDDTVSHKPWWMAPGCQPVYCDSDYMVLACAWADYCRRYPECKSLLSRVVVWLKGR